MQRRTAAASKSPGSMARSALGEEERAREALEAAFAAILTGDVPSEQIGAFLMGLAIRGETGAELLAGAKTLRSNARTIELDGPTLDTCGTGGLEWTSLHTSTASAIVIAAAMAAMPAMAASAACRA